MVRPDSGRVAAFEGIRDLFSLIAYATCVSFIVRVLTL